MKCWKDISIDKLHFDASNHKFTDKPNLKKSKNINLIPIFFLIRKSS